jgi:asparagine synthase (glutamine-hydrolysing)
MAGIAGWVDFERDLSAHRDQVRAMTASLARRGPDGEGLWASEHAILGHCRLAVIDPDGGGQPMVTEANGEPLAVLAYNGEVYNHKELRSELSSRGHQFRTRSDTEVVARSYLEWREHCPERLDGMFAFAVWDVRRGELLLVRDRLGIKPLYYYPTATGLLFGSEPKAILAHPLAEPLVDADGLRETFAFSGTQGRCAFRGMRKVLRGEVIRVRPAGRSERRFWQIPAMPHTDDLKTTVGTVRGLLEEAIGRQLESDVPMGAFLSGGLDSSSVAALASRLIRQRGGEALKTFALSFTAEAEDLPPDPIRPSFDAPFADQAARQAGTRHTKIGVDTKVLTDPAVRGAMVPAQHDMPYAVCEAHTTLFALCRAVRAKATVALMGEWADTLFGAFLGVHDPEVIKAQTLPWVAFTQKYACATGLGTGLLDHGLLKQLDIPGYCVQRYQDALAEVPYLPSESDRERRMREICYLHLMGWLEIGVATDDGIGMAAGMELRVPYLDHRLVQYVFNTPWSMKTFDGRPKSLLRAAVADLLPKTVLERTPSPFPITHDPAYAQYLRGALADLLADRGAPMRPLLDVDAAERLVMEPSALASGWRARTDIEMVLQTNSWLEGYGIRLL